MKQALTLENIKKIDKSDMLGVLLDFPLQCRQALEIAQNLRALPQNRGIKKIVFSGVGGSAIGAELVRCYLYSESRLPVEVIREYELPAYVDRETLVFVVSYSGNTEETLSAYTKAKEKGAQVIAISSGGKLKAAASSDGVTFIAITGGLPPRYAIGFLSTIPLYILEKLGLISEVGPAVEETVRVLEELKANIGPHSGITDNISKYTAQKLYNKFTFIYSASEHFEVVGTRFRSQLNENSKALAYSGVFPEVNHNEIMGWENPKKLFKDFVAVMLRDSQQHPQINKRMEITKELLKKEGINTLEIFSRGEGLLARIFSLIYIGDFISFYLAVLYGADPASTDKITYLKQRLV